MASAGSIFVDLLLKDAQYKAGLGRASKYTKNATGSWKRDLGGVQGSFSALTSAAGKLAGVLGVSFSLVGLARAADEVALLSARLEQSTQSTAEFNRAFSALSSQAIEVGTSLANGVEIFQRLSFSRKEIDATNEEMIAFVETVQKLGAVSGASGVALNAGLLQLGQGLSAGVLRAEEFNSIMENIPAIGTAIAEEFGVSVGQLRQLVLAGEVLSKDVMTAILRQQDEANAKFAEMPVTIERGFSSVKTGISLFAFELNNALGLTEGIGSGMQYIGEKLRENVSLARSFGEFISDGLFGLRALSLALGGPENADELRKALEDRVAKNNKSRLEQNARDYKNQYDAITRQMNATMNSQKAQREFEKNYAEIAGGLGGDDKAAKKAAAAAKKEAEELARIFKQNETYITGLNRETIKYNETLAELARLADEGVISGTQFSDAVARLTKEFEDSQESVNSWGINIKEFGKRAASNIQDAFADFLFDPFDQGLKGMAKGFIDTVRKMIAEAQAAQLAKALFGDMAGGKGAGFLGKILGGIGIGNMSTAINPSQGFGSSISWSTPRFFADGGYLEPGKFGIAGEAGAELLYGGKTGVSVFNQDQMGRGGNTYYVDAKGADSGAVQRIQNALLVLAGPGVIEQRVINAQTRGAL